MSLAEETDAASSGSPILGYTLTAVGVASAFAAMFVVAGPLGQVATLAAVLIPVAVAGCLAVAPAAYEISSARYRRRMVNLVLVLPAGALLVMTINAPMARPEINWLLACAGAAVALLAGIWTPERRTLASPGALFLVLALMGAGWGWGAPVLLDMRLDLSAGTPFQAPVLERHLSFGRYGSAQYYLRLGAWGPVGEARNVTVTYATYAATQVGSLACITLHPGALAMPWYSARAC